MASTLVYAPNAISTTTFLSSSYLYTCANTIHTSSSSSSSSYSTTNSISALQYLPAYEAVLVGTSCCLEVWKKEKMEWRMKGNVRCLDVYDDFYIACNEKGRVLRGRMGAGNNGEDNGEKTEEMGCCAVKFLGCSTQFVTAG